MPNQCDNDNEAAPAGFIGYQLLQKSGKELVRIYLNCKDASRFEASVDVSFSGDQDPHFDGLTRLSAIKKFNRFIGALEERAREENIPRERVFQSAKDLLYFLSKIKNSKNFGN